MRPSAAISGLPELPPTMSLFVERLNGVERSSEVLAVLPARGHAERLLTGRALEQPAQARERLDGRAVLDPALHAAEVQPQRERRIGVDARAERCEPRARDLLVRHLDDRFDVVLVPFAQLARFGVERAREHDERVRRRVDGGLAAVPERHADRGVGEARAVDEARRDLVGSLRREQALHDGRIGAEPFAHALERERQRQPLELGIDRHGRAELLLQARQEAVRVLAQPLGVRLRALGRRANQRARVARQAGC